jgi:2-polyprenyl-3-methyl-5-hydroxy-6-metoxy-1,4-benzoquinol methylase
MSDDDARARWDKRHASRDPIETHEPESTLVATCSGLRPGRALDLACGDGRNATWLASNGWDVTAVDFSSVALDRAATSARAAGVTVAWQQHDLLDWQPAAAAFELVTLVFLHLPGVQRSAVYAAAARAVAPGGRLVIVGHDRTNLADGVGGPQDPEVLFTADEVAVTLPAGFVVERAATVRRGDGPDRVPIDAIVVARRSGSDD